MFKVSLPSRFSDLTAEAVLRAKSKLNVASVLAVVCVILALPLASLVRAEPLRIVIDDFSRKPQPIAVAAFEWTGQGKGPSVDIAEVISFNLSRSGFFEPIPQQEFISSPTFGGTIRFQTWRTVGADYLVLGRIIPQGSDQYILEYELFDVYKGTRIAGYQVPTPIDRVRNATHFISDLIYQDLTGRRGAFNTQIAYVKAEQKPDKSRQYQLYVADSDGRSEFLHLSTSEPIMSPVWSPNRRRLAYVSFQNGKPQIFVKEVESSKIEAITSFQGINGAPVWSPDSHSLAFVLSKDGNPEIYVRDLRRSDMLRVTFNQAIDTEPTWSPDGRTLIFTSDRSTGTQLYQIDVMGGEARRLTFEGSYNSGATFSPDGRHIAYVHRDENRRYRIAMMDLHTRQIRLLTQGPLDESPAFSPNGDMILYTSKEGSQSALKSVARNGQGHTLISRDGDYQQPTWAPYFPQ
jgi:TolB protein